MPKKVTTESSKTKAPKTSKSKSLSKAPKAVDSPNQKSSSKTHAERSAVSGKFVSAKTGRIVKSSPSMPRLGRERILTAVRNYVRGDDKTRRFSD